MKKSRFLPIALVMASFNTFADDEAASKTDEYKVANSIVITPEKELSYALGMKIALQWREEGYVVDPEIVALAIGDIQNFGPRRISTEGADLAIFREKAKQRRAQEAVLAKKKASADAYMTENKKQPGIVTSDSGLQYVIHKKGDGAAPKADSDIVVNYTGLSALKGNIFGAAKAHEPGSEFNMANVIAGWKEGLPLINEGGKITLYVPPELAYGEKGIKVRNLYVVEPNDALVFDIELVKVN